MGNPASRIVLRPLVGSLLLERVRHDAADLQKLRPFELLCNHLQLRLLDQIGQLMEAPRAVSDGLHGELSLDVEILQREWRLGRVRAVVTFEVLLSRVNGGHCLQRVAKLVHL